VSTGKVTSKWEQFVEKPDEPQKLTKQTSIRDPNKVALGQVWETTVLAQPQDKPQTMKKDIEDLKSLMAKERQTSVQFSKSSQQLLFDEVKSQSDYLKYIFNEEDYRSWDFDTLLINWVNKILSQNQISRRVVNITEDFKDSFIYITLMDIILETGTNILSNEDTLQKAKEVVIFSSLLERESVITEDGILSGVDWQNESLLSSLFITAAALCPME